MTITTKIKLTVVKYEASTQSTEQIRTAVPYRTVNVVIVIFEM